MMKRLTYLNPFSKASRYLLALLLISPLAALAQDGTNDEDLEEVQGFTVTGSRIQRLDTAPVNPVVQLTREELDSTGFSTVGDAIRSLPQNSGQSLVPSDAGTSFTPGISTFNLRGLGNNNVLVLVNGRRTAPFGASGFNGFQTMFDFNSLPSSAIESIEILKDGGSAVYGSDAVAGVVNIKLRRDYEGMNTTLGFGDSTEAGMSEKSAFFIWGANTAKTSVTLTADWYERDRLYSRELDWTRSADKRDRGGSDDRSSAPYPANVVPNYLPYTDADGNQILYYDIYDGSGNTVSSGLVNKASDAPTPGSGQEISVDPVYLRNFVVPNGASNAPTLPSMTPFPGTSPAFPLTLYNIYPDFLTYPAPTANPTLAGLVDSDFDQYGRYDFLADPVGGSDLFPDIKQYGFYASVRHELTDKMYVFGDFSYRKVEIQSRSAPTPIFSFNENGDAPDGTMNIPAENIYNPFGADIDFQHRFRMVPTGNRINDVTSDTPRLLLGIGAELSDTWTAELGVLYTENSYANTNSGTVSDLAAQEAYNGVDFVDDDGNSVTLYLNPFGPSDPRIIDYVTTTNPIKSVYTVSTIDFNAAGSIFEMAAGDVGLAVGAEYREEEITDTRTALNEMGLIVGGSEGSSVFGSRQVKALYAEVGIPVTEMIEVQVAGRYEDYSDFGDTTKPKVALKVRPIDSLLFRASYGQSFLAPNLPYLYSAQSTSFSSGFLADPLRPQDPNTQIKQLGGGNPDLDPEETDTYYVGVAYEPTDGILEGMFASVDFFVFDSTNLISSLSAQEVLRDFADDPKYVTRRTPAPGEQYGQIETISVQWQNLSDRLYRGVDYVIGYNWQTENWGDFRAKMEVTQLLAWESEDVEYEGTWLYPEYRGNITLAWNYGDWAASMYVNYVHERDDGSVSGDNGKQLEGIDFYDAQWSFNPQVSYSGLWDSTITLGVRNLFNEPPPFDNNDPIGYTVGVNDGSPRFVYVRLSRDF